MARALVTGSSSGFGLTTCELLAARGHEVLAAVRDPQGAHALREAAERAGGRIEIVAMDVRDDDSVSTCVRAALETGALDLLVNNAGVSMLAAVETGDLDTARDVFETNLWGSLRTTRAVLPSMRERGRGVIVNVTSIAARIPGVMYAGWYAASKHAIGTLSEALSMEVAPLGIRVVCVEPGFYDTGIGRTYAQSDPDDPYRADRDWVARYQERSISSGPSDCTPVAEAIIRALEDPDCPLHLPVGQDAEFLTQTIASPVAFEDFAAMAQSATTNLAGERPTSN